MANQGLQKGFATLRHSEDSPNTGKILMIQAVPAWIIKNGIWRIDALKLIVENVSENGLKLISVFVE